MLSSDDSILAVRVMAAGVFNSFRDPTSHKTQRTLYLPPRTTLLGIAGAALGVPKDRLESLKHLHVSAVLAGIEGVARDLWYYRSVKYEGRRGFSVGPSLVFRDLLYKGRFILYFQTENSEEIERIRNAFLDPVYALTLGMADELVRVESSEITALRPWPWEKGVTNTIIPEDVRTGWRVKLPPEIHGRFEPPAVVRFPVDDSPRFLGEERRVYSIVYGVTAIPDAFRVCWTDGERGFFLF